MARKNKPDEYGATPKKHTVDTSAADVNALVGTYRRNQLEKWKGYYCWPLNDVSPNAIALASSANALWLFCGKQPGKYFTAQCLGEKTREELVRDFAYPASGKAHAKKYLLFSISPAYPPNFAGGDADGVKSVIVRTSDFSNSRNVCKRIAKLLKSNDRSDKNLTSLLPESLLSVPADILQVCDSSPDWGLFSWDDLDPVKMPKKNAFTAVELFAGAGGLSIGLEKAGINVVIANEIMPDFADTLRANHPDTNVINEDIHRIDFRKELKKLGLDSVDVLSGGPPCQGFSTIGSKNRQDPRNSLFYEYLRAVAETNPKYTIFENVSGFKRMYGGFAYSTLVKELNDLGYDTSCRILNAADYGAPQIRYRTIVLGWKKGLPPLEFPAPTHGAGKEQKPYVTLMEAIGDLPKLGAGQSETSYSSQPQSEYQKSMRGSQSELTEHNAANYGEKMREILDIVPPGGSIKDLPERLRPKSAYCNTYARLLPGEPSPTITRNFGTPSSSRCIHPFQPRALSTREGARLQGFPDNYVFKGGKQSKNLQIGNAVPPILGEAIASVVGDALRRGLGK